MNDQFDTRSKFGIRYLSKAESDKLLETLKSKTGRPSESTPEDLFRDRPDILGADAAATRQSSPKYDDKKVTAAQEAGKKESADKLRKQQEGKVKAPKAEGHKYFMGSEALGSGAHSREVSEDVYNKVHHQGYKPKIIEGEDGKSVVTALSEADQKAEANKKGGARGGKRVGAGRKPSKKSYDEMYYNNLIISGDDSITAKLKAITHELKSDKKKALIEGLKSTTYELKAIAESLKGGGWRKDLSRKRKKPKTHVTPTHEDHVATTTDDNRDSTNAPSTNETGKEKKGTAAMMGKEAGDDFMEQFYARFGRKREDNPAEIDQSKTEEVKDRKYDPPETTNKPEKDKEKFPNPKKYTRADGKFDNRYHA